MCNPIAHLRQARARAKGYAWAIVAVAAAASSAHAADVQFAKGVNLDKARLIAVQNDGRLKTLDTLARETVKMITGSVNFTVVGPDGKKFAQDPVFTFLDMVFNPRDYRENRTLFIKKKPIRESICDTAYAQLDDATVKRALGGATLNDVMRDGLVSQAFLELAPVRAKLVELDRDLMRGAKEIEGLANAASLSNPRALKEMMRVIPPPGAESVEPRWHTVAALGGNSPHDMHGGGNMSAMAGEKIPGMNPDLQLSLSQNWDAAAQAWAKRDPLAATAALNAFASDLRSVAPGVYPRESKLALEHWYYKYDKMTWTWCFYMLAVIFLLMGIVYRWPRAWKVGAGLYAIAFLLHTIASGMRWYLAGRIPNTNMFEAVTAAAWLGGLVVVFYEIGPVLARRRWTGLLGWLLTGGGFAVFLTSLAARGVAFHAWQQWGVVPTTSLIITSVGLMILIAIVTGRQTSTNGLALLGAATVSMVALMCGHFMTIRLDSDISPRMPVLNDVWLYIHTNMIIASYALIGIAYVTAAMYVVGRMLTRPSNALWLAMLIPSAVFPMAAILPIGDGTFIDRLEMLSPAWLPFIAVVVLTFVCYIARALFGSGLAARSYSVWEGLPLGMSGMVGAGSRAVPILARSPNAEAGNASAAVCHCSVSSGATADTAVARAGSEGLARVLDGATMLLLELSFITLWTGIIMGAVWADHSWGRPWGWDPKEVFALNTWIIFLILVHVRLKVKDKPLWTAILAVVGTAVMMFNWVVVNFFITGLHSYA
jgi:ABC-type transport system involved in cytochrome c biogenesis permease subunit